jgi:hypothetical protein
MQRKPLSKDPDTGVKISKKRWRAAVNAAYLMNVDSLIRRCVRAICKTLVVPCH